MLVTVIYVKRKYVAGCCLLLGGWFALAWISARILIINVPLEHADIIVVLSGSSAYIERTELAARLYKEGRATQLVLTNDNRQSGWSNSEQRNPFYFERARWELERLGIPASNIEVIAEPVDSTYDEAALLRAYAVSRQVHSILLVTSAYHSRRAFQTFRKSFIGTGITIGLASVPPGAQSPPPATWWFHLRGWELVAGEYLKLFVYKLRDLA
jgi:uncharacterized SAM-binding protein YcdF (DUF218 family)